ncbi:DUF5979 domain-containing protein [Streptomyces gamaensis]|uniref:DUF5979 domain-containing protein n=1 Tax=Streptomyces gamaensis TaxID=1763542 RepID=A0ABW0Z609_9ACTN
MQKSVLRAVFSLVVIGAVAVAVPTGVFDGDERPADAEVGIRARVSAAGAPLEPGRAFEYGLTATCSSLTVACVNAVVEDTLPAGFEITSLPRTTDSRQVAYDAGSRRLTVRYREALPGPPNPSGSVGLPAGAGRDLAIGMRVPAETTLDDGTSVENAPAVSADNAEQKSAAARVRVRVPRQVRTATTVKWADGSAVARSGAESAVTLGARNASSPSARVTALTTDDTARDAYDAFDVKALGPVRRFPAGTDRVRALVCVKPLNSPCADKEFTAGPYSSGPEVPLPDGVAPDRITGVRFAFDSEDGDTLPYDPKGGEADVKVGLRDTLRSTGAPLTPAARRRVNWCAATTARDADSGKPVTGPPTCAGFDVLPHVATVQGTTSYFSDADGNYVADGTAVTGTRAPVSMVTGARNTSSFPVAALTVTEPAAGARGDFARFDTGALRVEFPAGARSATVGVVCRGGARPAPLQLSGPPARQDVPATGCPPGAPPSQVTATFHGTDAAGHGTIRTDALATLSLHGTLNDQGAPADPRTGIADCADVTASDPVDGAAPGTGTACGTLRVQNPVSDIRGAVTESQTEIPPDQPVTHTLDLANAGNTPLDRPAVTAPADPGASGNPFDAVRLTKLAVTYRNPAGAPVQLEVLDPNARTWVAYNPADAGLLSRARGVRGRLADGALPPQGRFMLAAEFVRRDGVADRTGFRDCAQITSAGRPVGQPYCTHRDSITEPPSGGGTVQTSVSPSTVARALSGVARQQPEVRIKALNTGNINLKQLVVTDVDPGFFDGVDFQSLTGVTFPPGANRVRVDVCTSKCTASPPAFTPGTTTDSTTPGLPSGVDPGEVRGLRVTFTSAGGGHDLVPGEAPPSTVCPATVCFKVAARGTPRSDPDKQIPGQIENTAQAAGESPLQGPGELFDIGRSEAALKVQNGTAQLEVATAPDARIGPTEAAPFTLTVRNTGNGPVPGLVVTDPVPDQLRFDQGYVGDGGLPFKVTAKVPPGTPAPPPPVYEPARGDDGSVAKAVWRWPSWTLLPGAEVRIAFQVRLAPGVPAGSVAQNASGAGSESRNDVSCQSRSARDGQVSDDSENFGPGRYCTSRAEVTALPGTGFEATQWIAGNDALGFHNTATHRHEPLDSPGCPVLKQDGRTYTSYPCTALVQPGEKFDHLVRAVNTGTDPAVQLRLLNVLPYKGDTGVLLGNQQRGTEWEPRPRLAGAPQLAGPGTLETRYATVTNPCSPLLDTPRRDCGPAGWNSAYTEDATGVAMTVSFGTPLPPGGQVSLRLPMAAPVDLGVPGDPAVAWSSLAHAETVVRAGKPYELPATEPPKAGVGMRFGNLRVDKVATDAPPGVNLGPYKVTHRCTVTPQGGTAQIVRAGTSDATLHTPVTLTAVPAGATCLVWESDAAGARSSHFGEANALRVVITPAGPDEEGQHVSITDTYPRASLVVRNHITGPAAPEAAKGPFAVRVDCSAQGQSLPGFPKDLTFERASEQSLDGLPNGARCTAAEPRTGGASAVAVTPTDSADPHAAVIGSLPGRTAGLTVTNDFATGGLRVVKKVLGPGSRYADRTFRFRIACTFNGRRDAVVRTLALRAPNLTGELRDLPAGAVCTVTETDPGGADRTPPPVGPVTVRPGPAATVSTDISNAFSTGRLTLRKAVDGAPADAPYVRNLAFAVSCVREAEGPDGTPATAFVVRGDYALSAANTLEIPAPLPIGTRCWAEQRDTGGAASATTDHGDLAHAAVVTKDTPDITITAKNGYRTGTLRLGKKINGNGARFAAGRSYALLLNCTLETAPGRTLTLVDRRRYTFTGTGEHPVDDLGFPLPAGTRCWAVEADTGGASAATVDHGGPEQAVTIEGTDDRTATITATNTYTLGRLTVANKVTGEGDGGYTFTVDCATPRPGGGTTPVGLSADDSRFTLDDGERRTIDAPLGSVCAVREIERPKGARTAVADSDPGTAGSAGVGTGPDGRGAPGARLPGGVGGARTADDAHGADGAHDGVVRIAAKAATVTVTNAFRAPDPVGGPQGHPRRRTGGTDMDVFMMTGAGLLVAALVAAGAAVRFRRW